jgi:hypothetical protein
MLSSSGAQNILICTVADLSELDRTAAHNGGYLKSSLDNAWWAGISAA